LDRIVIAPLMLSATGVAAESAVEGYVAQRRSQIVDKRLESKVMLLRNTIHRAPRPDLRLSPGQTLQEEALAAQAGPWFPVAPGTGKPGKGAAAGRLCS
jgi:hypothetical protein